jgi:Flp pilus assembly pilin Flp
MMQLWRDDTGLESLEYVAVGAMVALILLGLLAQAFGVLQTKLSNLIGDL